MIRATDDVTVIGQFLEGSTSVRTPNLKVQISADSTQLLAKDEGVVATIRRVQYTQTISLKLTSSYYESIKELLVERHFFPVCIQDELGFEHYRRNQVPEGYAAQYTSAKILWREWRFTWHEKSANRLRRGILISCRQTWYPIHEIDFYQGKLIVKTLASNLVLTVDTPIIWLKQVHAMPRAKIKAMPMPIESMPIEDVYPNLLLSAGKAVAVKELTAKIAEEINHRPFLLSGH